VSDVTHRRSRVLICDAIAPEGVAILEEHFDVDVRPGLTSDELCDIVGDYEALIVRSATRVTREVIAMGDRLKVIARAGAGLDTIDVVAAVERGIQVINAPDANTLAVAELTMGLVLALARNLVQADGSMKDGRWEKSRLLGHGLVGKTLGIIGFGRIGQAVAVRAHAFGMRVVTNQRRPTPELYLEAGVEPLDLFDLLAQSDFVTLHVPARPETEGLINAETLGAMKPTAYLINTARGSVVDEAALLDALDRGVIAGAALDVFSTEPAVDNPLTAHRAVIATPHLGASTRDAQTSAAEDVARHLVTLLSTRPAQAILPVRFVDLDDVVPHEATDPRRAERLARRIEEDRIVRNPPIVARFDDRYVVLDGATRTAALRMLGYRHAVVQDVPTDELGLETWHHVIRELPAPSLIHQLSALSGIRLEECEPEEAADRVIEYGGLCAILTTPGEGYVAYGEPGINRFDALAAIADAYISRSVVSRTLERNLERLSAWYPDATALVEYPQFTVEQVLLAAKSGRLLPAGVTRFVVPGRVLRLEISVDHLADDRSLEEKNRWLHDHLAEMERRGRIRYYREPVYLLDE
jgi:phosphoglycerate dehydrogenase-like enzyme